MNYTTFNSYKMIDDVYLVYAYRGEIKIKHGYISLSCNFVPDSGTYPFHTKLAEESLVYRCGKVWCCNKNHIPLAIQVLKDHYIERIKDLEKSNSLAYAEQIVEEAV